MVDELKVTFTDGNPTMFRNSTMCLVTLPPPHSDLFVLNRSLAISRESHPSQSRFWDSTRRKWHSGIASSHLVFFRAVTYRITPLLPTTETFTLSRYGGISVEEIPRYADGWTVLQNTAARKHETLHRMVWACSQPISR